MLIKLLLFICTNIPSHTHRHRHMLQFTFQSILKICFVFIETGLKHLKGVNEKDIIKDLINIQSKRHAGKNKNFSSLLLMAYLALKLN